MLLIVSKIDLDKTNHARRSIEGKSACLVGFFSHVGQVAGFLSQNSATRLSATGFCDPQIFLLRDPDLEWQLV